MKKLLSLLSTITITGTALPIVIATSPYEKQLQTNKIEKDSENNLEKLNRNKRKNNNKPIIINSYQDDNKNNLIYSNYEGQKVVITTNGEIQCSGVVLNDKVYFGSNDGNVYEYDPSTQQQKIVIKATSGFGFSGAIFNNKLYFGANNGNIYEYDPATGQQIKKFEVANFVMFCTVVLNGKLYVSTLYDGVFELDLVTGQQKNVISKQEVVSPSDGVVLNGKLYFGSRSNGSNVKAYEYDPVTGQKKVVIVANAGMYRGIVLNDKVYFTSNDKNVYEYDPATEKSKIAFRFVYGSSGGVALNGKIYFMSYNSIIECNPTTGREQEVIKAKSYFTSDGVVLNGKVYFGSLDRNVYEYDPVTEQQKVVITINEIKDFRSSGVAFNGKLYIGSDDHNVYEYNPTTIATNEIFEKWYEFLEHDRLKIKLNFDTVNQIKNLLLNNKKEKFLKIFKKIINNIPKSDHSGAGGSITNDDINVITNFIWEHFSYFNEIILSLKNNQAVFIKTNTIGYWDNSNPNNSIYIN